VKPTDGDNFLVYVSEWSGTTLPLWSVYKGRCDEPTYIMRWSAENDLAPSACIHTHPLSMYLFSYSWKSGPPQVCYRVRLD